MTIYCMFCFFLAEDLSFSLSAFCFSSYAFMVFSSCACPVFMSFSFWSALLRSVDELSRSFCNLSIITYCMVYLFLAADLFFSISILFFFSNSIFKLSLAFKVSKSFAYAVFVSSSFLFAWSRAYDASSTSAWSSSVIDCVISWIFLASDLLNSSAFFCFSSNPFYLR